MSEAHVLYIYRGQHPETPKKPEPPRKRITMPKGCRKWTPAEEAWLARWYPTVRNRCLASLLDRTLNAIGYRGKQLGLKKKPHKVQPNKKTGVVIWLRHNNQPQRFLRINGVPISMARYNWEQAHGPIPPGHVIRFVDGNAMNDDLSNLRMVSRADHMDEFRPKTAEDIAAKNKKTAETRARIKNARQVLEHYGVRLS